MHVGLELILSIQELWICALNFSKDSVQLNGGTPTIIECEPLYIAAHSTDHKDFLSEITLTKIQKWRFETFSDGLLFLHATVANGTILTIGLYTTFTYG